MNHIYAHKLLTALGYELGIQNREFTCAWGTHFCNQISIYFVKEAKQKYFRVLLQLRLLNSILFISKLYRFKYLFPGGFSPFLWEYPNYTDKNTVEKRPVDLHTLEGRNLCVCFLNLFMLLWLLLHNPQNQSHLFLISLSFPLP